MKDKLQPSLETMASMGLDVEQTVKGVDSISYKKPDGEGYKVLPVKETLWITDYSPDGDRVEHTVFVPTRKALFEMRADMGV